MIIGVDLHGVIDSKPEYFKGILPAIRAFGDLVYVISGPPTDDIRSELGKCGLYQGMHYDDIFSVVDHLKEKGIKMWQDERERWWTYDEEWWKAKAEICEKHNVDLLIDDKIEWAAHFKNINAKTKFLLYGG